MRVDNIKITQQIRIIQFFKTFKLICIIFLSSYFLGMIFHIVSEIFHEMKFDSEISFFDYHNLHHKTSIQMCIIVTYYAFTSLSTVGFGDFSPRSDSERIFILIALFVGVIMFSYILSCLQDLMTLMRDFYSEYGEDDQLTKFIVTLKNFNEGHDLDKKIVESLELFFKHKWQTDKNNALSNNLELLFFD